MAEDRIGKEKKRSMEDRVLNGMVLIRLITTRRRRRRLKINMSSSDKTD